MNFDPTGRTHNRSTTKQNKIKKNLKKSFCFLRFSYRYSSPQPLTKLIRIEQIRVRLYTASYPSGIVLFNICANSVLLKIFKLQRGGILQTVAGCQLNR